MSRIFATSLRGSIRRRQLSALDIAGPMAGLSVASSSRPVRHVI